MRRWAIVAAWTAAAATVLGCSLGPDEKPATRDEIVAFAGAADTVAARTGARQYAQHLADAVRVHGMKQVADGIDDHCIGGDIDMYYRAEFKMTCDSHTTLMLSAPAGDLIALLRNIDAAAQRAGGQPSQPFGNLEYFLRHDGKSADGLLLSCPEMSYSFAPPPAASADAGVWTLNVDWADRLKPTPPHCATAESPQPAASATFDADYSTAYTVLRRPVADASTPPAASRVTITFLIWGTYRTAAWG